MPCSLSLKRVIQITILLLFSLTALAQDPYAISISRSEGLPSNTVYYIFQDSKGFIWITTTEGLSRYDGYEFKTYTSKGQSSKAGSEIHEDKYGRIWYQNFDGFLFYIKHDSLQKLIQNEPIGYFHYGIVGNRLFVVQKKGVDIYDLKTLSLIKTVMIDPVALGATHYTNAYFYMFSKQLYRIDSVGKMQMSEMPDLKDEEKPSLMQKKDDELFLVSSPNRYKQCYYVKNKLVTKKFSLNEAMGVIHSLAFADSTYWFCTPRGVYGYRSDGRVLNNDSAFFKDKSISYVLHDREGNYWFSTLNEGLLLVPNLKARFYKTEYKPGKIKVNKNALYVGSKNDALYTFDLSKRSSKLIYNGGPNQEIYYLDYDSTDHKLFFTSNGFRIAEESGKLLLRWPPSVKDFQRIDDKYYAYAATGLAGLISLRPRLKSKWDVLLKNKEHLDTLTDIQLINSMRAKSLAFNEEENCIYYATSNGLFRVDTSSTKQIKYQNTSVYITKLEACAGRIFGLDEQGNLYELLKGKLFHLSLQGKEEEDGEIKTIKSAGGFLFLSSFKELYYLRPSEQKIFLHKIAVSISPQEISDIDVWQEKLVVATDAGLLFPEFNIQSKNSVTPLFLINSFKVNGKLLNDYGSLPLNYNENTIDINYSILRFRRESEYPLYYKINDQFWEMAAPESRNLKLAALSPGDYTILFRLGDSAAKRDLTGTLKFVITKPWWTQHWFILLCFISILGAIYTYYKWQITLLHNRNKLLSEKMELEKHLNHSILTSIRSQMNPHFFYNALNTIQSFIFSDDKKNAAAYLSKFSKLTRTILEHSEKEKITLNEEITALTLYLDIEKVRFNDDFDFRITVDETIDKDLVKIPPMLMQPYVENAIKHGLLHKKGKKELLIDFQPDEGFLQVSIDDNGIGRKRCEELNKIKQGAHQSFASNANQMRLEILNKDNKTKTAVRYVDKTDEENRAAGTTVIIHLPMNK